MELCLHCPIFLLGMVFNEVYGQLYFQVFDFNYFVMKGCYISLFSHSIRPACVMLLPPEGPRKIHHEVHLTSRWPFSETHCFMLRKGMNSEVLSSVYLLKHFLI
jgi:hypothetical protein